MGLLIDGTWHARDPDTKASGGRFVRQESQFRDWVTAEGSTPYRSHTSINPNGIVPLGPLVDLAAPHDRERFSA
jgi:glutathionyl-hydroquinone reductase